MKTKTKTKILAIAMLVSLMFAVAGGTEASIVPCGNNGVNSMCTLCHLIVGIYQIVEFGLRMAFVVALAILTVAGVIYIVSAGSTEIIEKAKSAIKGALLGTVVVFTAWIIVNTVMMVLATGGSTGLASEGWTSKFNCSSSSSSASTAPPVSTAPPSTTAPPASPSYPPVPDYPVELMSTDDLNAELAMLSAEDTSDLYGGSADDMAYAAAIDQRIQELQVELASRAGM